MTRLASAPPINPGPSVAAVSFVRLLFQSSAECITLTLLNTGLVDPRVPSIISVTGRNLVGITYTTMSTTTTITPEEIQALDLYIQTAPMMKYISIAALTLFTWDLILTFPHEIMER